MLSRGSKASGQRLICQRRLNPPARVSCAIRIIGVPYWPTWVPPSPGKVLYQSALWGPWIGIWCSWSPCATTLFSSKATMRSFEYMTEWLKKHKSIFSRKKDQRSWLDKPYLYGPAALALLQRIMLASCWLCDITGLCNSQCKILHTLTNGKVRTNSAYLRRQLSEHYLRCIIMDWIEFAASKPLTGGPWRGKQFFWRRDMWLWRGRDKDDWKRKGLEGNMTRSVNNCRCLAVALSIASFLGCDWYQILGHER